MTLLTVVATAYGQIADQYRQAAQAYRDAAAKSTGPNQQCYLANARYYDCLASQMTGGSANCRQPTCVMGGGLTSSGGGSGAGSIAIGGAGGSIQDLANQASGLIQQLFAGRAAKRAAEEAAREQEEQAQQDAAERARQAEALKARMRAFEAERIQEESCKILIEAARLTGGSVDLGGDNACSRAINAELGPLSTYASVGGANPSRRTNFPGMTLDGSNIPTRIDFGNVGPGRTTPSSNAIDSLTAATSPGGPSGSSSQNALDSLTAATSAGASSDAGGSSNTNPLDQLTQATTSQTGAGRDNSSMTQTNPLDQLTGQTGGSTAQGGQPTLSSSLAGNPNSGNSTSGTGLDPSSTSPSLGPRDSPDTPPPVADLVNDAAKAAAKGVINLNPDGKAILGGFEKGEDYWRASQKLPEQVALANRYYDHVPTYEDQVAVVQQLERTLASTSVVNPFARKAAQASLDAANDIRTTSLSILDRTFDTAEEGLDADGKVVPIASLNRSVSIGPLIYGVARNLPLVGKPIERVVTTYQQLQVFLHQ